MIKKLNIINISIPKKDGLYDIKIAIDIKMKDISFMFADCDNILSVDLSSFDSS